VGKEQNTMYINHFFEKPKPAALKNVVSSLTNGQIA
jgi:hypothetical protein